MSAASQPEAARVLLARTGSKGVAMSGHSPIFSRRLVLWRSGLLSLPFVVLVVLTIYSQFTSNIALTRFLEILCAVILLLLIIHYILSTSEHTRLVQEQEEQSAKVELLHKATASLSSVLEMDLLLDHIVSIGATELGFDAAALMVIEEYERPLDEHTSLLGRATLANTLQIAAWRINGKTLPSCTAFFGEELEIGWVTDTAHPFTPVHQWHAEQHFHVSLFVPLLYQERLLGCLAFSLREVRAITEHERFLARAFAEEAANALEHAHLYERARENAMFAQAMSNVAARLNSVVASGMGMGSEIHQLICTEGANALGADLAILYVCSPDGQFIPQAAVIGYPEPPTDPQEWPTLPHAVYASLLLDSSQPCLLRVDQLPYAFPRSAALPSPAAQQLLDAPATREKSNAARQGARPARVSLVPLHTNKLAQPGSPRLIITLQEALQRRAVDAAILAPLIIHQNPMGLLVLARIHQSDTPHRRAFASQDLAHAQDFAGQASIAFTNARLYQQLRNAHRRMQELDQLKDQFIMTASHELRTPLTAVQGYLELLEHYHDELAPDQYQEFLQKANRGCEELVLLLNNVMDASRLEIEAGIRPSHLERTSVREVIEHVIDLIGLRATQQLRSIQVHIPEHLMVKADPTHLRQVMLNLSTNALKYSPPGTPLIFSARPLATQGPLVVISVTDRGKGIKPQDQARIFQRFMRLERDLNSTVRGSGLGLYISRRLVEAMHGKIWIESTGIPGAGTTFHVQLPRA